MSASFKLLSTKTFLSDDACFLKLFYVLQHCRVRLSVECKYVVEFDIFWTF